MKLYCSVAKLALLLSVSLTLFGCTDSSDTPAADSGDCPANTTCTFKVGDKTAKEYYDQFLYKVVGSCKKDDRIEFQYFGSKEYIKLGQNERGHELIGSFVLVLEAQGTYYGEYKEHVMIPTKSPGTHKLEFVREESLRGKWRTNETRIEIDGIGKGIGLTYNREEQVGMQLDLAQIDSRIAGQVVRAGIIRSNIGKDGESINQYCGF